MVMSLERLDEEFLLELIRRHDPVGVLSVYADTRRIPEPHLAGVGIDVKNRFRDLQRAVADGSREGQPAEVAEALERIRPTVEALANPRESGRGRMLFTALAGDWTLTLTSAMPVRTRVVLDDVPFIHPLLELLDEGRPAGVLLFSPDETRLFEWRLGRMRLLSRALPDRIEAPHERAGQIGGGPAGQFHTPMREQRQARARDQTGRFLDQAARIAAALAAERGWARILVSGGDRWTEPAAEALPSAMQGSIVRDDRVLSGLQDGALEDVVSQRLHEERAAQQQHLVERVRDAAHEKQGAVGLSEVTAALNQGRVAHLIYDPDIRYAGSVGDDGGLRAGDESGPDGWSGTPEPRLTERLVERALMTGSLVSPVEGAARTALQRAAGIAALLRW